MALEIRSIPVLTGETAERFVREAEENERNPQRKALRMSFADVEKILVRSTANLKAHGGKSLLQSNCSLYRVTTKEELDSFSCGDYRPPVLRTATL